jgi:hypothetical protein
MRSSAHVGFFLQQLARQYAAQVEDVCCCDEQHAKREQRDRREFPAPCAHGSQRAEATL